MLMLRVKEESSPLVFFKADIDTCSCLSWQQGENIHDVHGSLMGYNH